MMKDTDDPREAELLEKILANSKTLEGSIFIGGEDGIHWKSIHAAAGVMKYLEANTLHSQGNFSFTTSSFVPDGTPFYPASVSYTHLDVYKRQVRSSQTPGGPDGP